MNYNPKELIIPTDPREIITLEELHKRIVIKAYIKYGGNIEQIAQAIKMSSRWVSYRIREIMIEQFTN